MRSKQQKKEEDQPIEKTTLVQSLQRLGIDVHKPAFWVGLAFDLGVILFLIVAINQPCIQVYQGTSGAYCMKQYDPDLGKYCMIMNETGGGYQFIIQEQNLTNKITYGLGLKELD